MHIPKHTYYTLPNKGWPSFWTEWLTQTLAYLIGYYSWFYLFPTIFNRPYSKLTLVSNVAVSIISLVLVFSLYKPLGRLLSSTNKVLLFSLVDQDGNKTYMIIKGRFIYGMITGTIYTTEEAQDMPLEELLATYPEAYVNDEGEVDIK